MKDKIILRGYYSGTGSPARRDGWIYCIIDVSAIQRPVFVLASCTTRREAIIAMTGAVAVAGPDCPA